MKKVKTIRDIINASGGHICSVVFVKLDGTVRRMVFKKSDAEQKKVGNMVVKEMKKGKKNCWKTIKLSNVQSLKVNGKSYNFGDK